MDTFFEKERPHFANLLQTITGYFRMHAICSLDFQCAGVIKVNGNWDIVSQRGEVLSLPQLIFHRQCIVFETP